MFEKCQFGTLARKYWHTLWHFGTFIGTLARKNENLARFWHVGMQAHWYINQAGTEARWHVNHAGMQSH